MTEYALACKEREREKNGLVLRNNHPHNFLRHGLASAPDLVVWFQVHVRRVYRVVAELFVRTLLPGTSALRQALGRLFIFY